MTNIISSRLLNQQLICPMFSNPADVVSHMGAMQAQEYRLMRWAVAMRCRRPSLKAFEQAFNKGDILRLHIMRGTWQLVSSDDYWWMLDLCSPKSKSVLHGWMSANRISIPDREISMIRDILIPKVESLHSVTKEDFVLAIQEKGIEMDDHRLSYHIRIAELDGILCSGDLTPNKATYSLSSTKVKKSSPIERDEALARLTRKYFQSHSPATLEDFTWWSGLNIGDCRRGISIIKNELDSFKEGGREFLLHQCCRTRGFRKGQVHLIPSYDEYLIGYKSRDIVLSPEHKAHAHNNSGIFYPIIAQDGVIFGNWSPFKKQIETEFFSLPLYPDDIQKAWEDYQSFLCR